MYMPDVTAADIYAAMDVRTACRLVSRRAPLSEHELTELLVRLAGRRDINADAFRRMLASSRTSKMLAWPVVMGILARHEMPSVVSIRGLHGHVAADELVGDPSLIGDILMQVVDSGRDRGSNDLRKYSWNTCIVFPNHNQSCFVHAVLAMFAMLPVDMQFMVRYHGVWQAQNRWQTVLVSDGSAIYTRELPSDDEYDIFADTTAVIECMRYHGMRCPEGTFARVHRAACGLSGDCEYGSPGLAPTLLENDNAQGNKMFPALFGVLASETVHIHPREYGCVPKWDEVGTIVLNLPRDRRPGVKHSVAELIRDAATRQSSRVDTAPRSCRHRSDFYGFRSVYRVSDQHAFIIVHPSYTGGVLAREHHATENSTDAFVRGMQTDKEAEMPAPDYHLDRLVPIGDGVLRLRSLLIQRYGHYLLIAEYNGESWAEINDVDPLNKSPKSMTFADVQAWVSKNHEDIHVVFVYSVHRVLPPQSVRAQPLMIPDNVVSTGFLVDRYSVTRDSVTRVWRAWLFPYIAGVKAYFREHPVTDARIVMTQTHRFIDAVTTTADKLAQDIRANSDVMREVTDHTRPYNNIRELVHRAIQSKYDTPDPPFVPVVSSGYSDLVGTNDLVLALTIGMLLQPIMQPVIASSLIPLELPIEELPSRGINVTPATNRKQTAYGQLIPPLVTHLQHRVDVWREWVPPFFISY